MGYKRGSMRAFALACLGAAITVISPAQTFTTLTNFPATGSQNPNGLLIQGMDGNFYGTAGGAEVIDCTIFKLTPSGAQSTLADLGSCLATTEVVQASDNNFYTALVTPSGGSFYRITPSGSATMIHQLASDLSEGDLPGQLMLGSDGALYGTNALGGAPNGLGTFYKLTLSGELTVLYDFTLATGIAPTPLVRGTDGNFYGVESSSPTQWTVYTLSPAGDFKILSTFTATTGGSAGDEALIQGSDGAFYGITENGGANNEGTIFKLIPPGTMTVLYVFLPSTGAKSALAQAPDGSFYGTAYGENDVYGSVFRLNPAGTFSTVHSFDNNDGYASGGADSREGRKSIWPYLRRWNERIGNSL